jgi:formylglycine-generating enzyme required for sulfatase activity
MTPTKNAPRVDRGGCWVNNVPSWVRAASRDTFEPAYPVTDVGFRTTLAGKMKR